MKRLMWVCAAIGAGALNVAIAGHGPETTAYTATACQAGLAGGHQAGRDSDADGVPDSEDWCVRSASGTRVGSNGCGIGEVETACQAGAPTAQAPRVVPVAGGKDSDGDGVADGSDRCPGTARGVPVDASGCAVIEKVVLRGVNFGSGSAILRPGASDTLRAVASAMKANPKLKVEIGGHSDSVGDDAKNKALSERRAQAVRNFLVKEGIAADRLSIRGYGETQPVDTNDTPEGRANNRRVAFRVVGS